MNDFLINTSIPDTLYSNMLTFRDSNRSFNLDGDLLETISIDSFNVGLSNPQDQKLNYEFGKEMKLNIKQKGQKSPRDEPLIKLLDTPAIMASGISTTFLSSDPNELCERLKLLQQKEQAGNISKMINEKTVALVDNFL